MNRFNNVDEFLNFVEKQKRVTDKVDLKDMQIFAKILGNPQKGFKSIHVTGTNGKGSVVRYLSEMYLSLGLKVGSFTSPFIEKFNERIQYNLHFIDDADLLKYANLIISKYDEFYSLTNTYPSFFEFITLIAFLYFNDLKVDIAIIEVGIGGLLDSTNIITPIASVISNVAYDHMNILGDTLPLILKQKLGIVKKDVPLITGIKDLELLNIVNDYCEKLNAGVYTPLFKAIEIEKCDLTGSRFTLGEYGKMEIKMKGYHQIENVAVAFETMMVTLPKLNLYHVDLNILKKALANTFWLGRFEVVSLNPLLVIDGGHNVDAINRITEFVKNLPYKTKRCIFACSDNKEKEKMLDLLKTTFDEIYITEFSYKRHTDALTLYQNFDFPNKKLFLNLDDAIALVKKNPLEFNIFIGSLYFVSEIRPKLLNS